MEKAFKEQEASSVCQLLGLGELTEYLLRHIVFSAISDNYFINTNTKKWYSFFYKYLLFGSGNFPSEKN